MSLIKTLEQDKKNNVNVVKLLKTIFPECKSKYIQLLVKLINTNKNTNNISDEFITLLFIKMGVDKPTDLTQLEKTLLAHIIVNFIKIEELEDFRKFIDFNEQGLIKNNDITSYKSIEEIQTEVNMAELRIEEKELKKQVIRMKEFGDWLIVKPLTYEASKKYGANTKWCTTDSDSDYSFTRYTDQGLLIYIINRETGVKIAMHKELKNKDSWPDGNLTFWNQKGDRLDSIQTGLPSEIINYLIEQLNHDFITSNKEIGIVEGVVKVADEKLKIYKTLAISEVSDEDKGINDIESALYQTDEKNSIDMGITVNATAHNWTTDISNVSIPDTESGE